jgi:hypothetical protein
VRFENQGQNLGQSSRAEFGVLSSDSRNDLNYASGLACSFQRASARESSVENIEEFNADHATDKIITNLINQS